MRLSVMLGRMATNRNKIIFSVRASDRFPEQVWRDFRAACQQRGEAWIDALRRVLEEYSQQEPKP